jgi:hypothetical protein
MRPRKLSRRPRTYSWIVPALLGLGAVPAHAQLIINATFDSSWSADATAAADETTITNDLKNLYQARYTNPVTVSLDFSDVNTGLGQSLTGIYSTDYNTYRTALTNDKQIINGGDGNTAFLANLTPGSNPVPGNSTAGVRFTSAQGRALGPTLGFNTPGVVTVVGQTGTFDSQISLNMGLIQSQGYGLDAVTEHETDEALGLGSALDGRGDIAGTATVSNVGSLDFFRYSSAGTRSFTSSSSAVSYFSDNLGVTPTVYFNEITGADYHDWASGPGNVSGTVIGPPQVQDAFGDPGNDPTLGSPEFKALNDVGYNTIAAPEPSAWASLSIGALGLLGLAARRRFRNAPGV